MIDSSASRLLAELLRFAEAHPAGTRLPTTRQLQHDHQIGPGTVRQAIAELCRRGLAETRPGSGAFTRAVPKASVRADHSWQAIPLGPAPSTTQDQSPISAGSIDLSSGYLDPDLQPTSLLMQAGARASRRAAAWTRPPLEGMPELRALFAQELGTTFDADDVLITPGAQPALIACFRTLTQAGDTVLVEAPTYPGALTAIQSAGLVALGVPADEHGLRTDHLEQALQRTGAKVIYAQPRWLNPTGSRMTEERRRDMRSLLERFGTFLIEDDCSRDLELGTTPYVPMINDDPNGHVIYIRSLTRHSGPGMRIATIVARGPVMTRLRNVRRLEGFFVAALLQSIACEVLTAPTWERHLRRVRSELIERRNTLANAVASQLDGWTLSVMPTCGVHLWFQLPDDANENLLVEQASVAGVAIAGGASHFPAEPTGPFIRLSYGSSKPDQLVEAVTRLQTVD